MRIKSFLILFLLISPSAKADDSDLTVWRDSGDKIYGGVRNGKIRYYKYKIRVDPDNPANVQLSTRSSGIFGRSPYPINDFGKYVCKRLLGTQEAGVLTEPENGVWPATLTVSCLSREEHQLALEKQRKEESERERARLEEEEKQAALKLEEQKKLAAEKLQAKKDECSSFGFEPKTNAHSECVMKLAIAEKARNEMSKEAAQLSAEASQKQKRRIQAEREVAEREAQKPVEQKRKKVSLFGGPGFDPKLLSEISAAIADKKSFADGVSAAAEAVNAASSRQCFYRVAGDRVSVSVPRAEACTATRSFGSQTGYLTR